MSVPDTLDEFDRFLASESPVEKYVSLGLIFEEILEKLRTKPFEAEKQALEKVLELPQARANLIHLGAQQLLDAHREQLEQAFADNPRKWGEPLSRLFKQNRDELERVVTTKLAELTAFGDTRSRHTGSWAKPVLAAVAAIAIVGLLALILHRLGIFDPMMMKVAMR